MGPVNLIHQLSAVSIPLISRAAENWHERTALPGLAIGILFCCLALYAPLPAAARPAAIDTNSPVAQALQKAGKLSLPQSVYLAWEQLFVRLKPEFTALNSQR